MIELFIPGNVPNSKDGMKTSRGIFHKKPTREYLQNLGVKSFSSRRKTVEGYKTRPNMFAIYTVDLKAYLETIVPPYLFGFHFVRNSRRDFDFSNACQILADLLTAHHIIPDDNMKFFLPTPLYISGLGWYSIDKHKPGVMIRASHGRMGE